MSTSSQAGTSVDISPVVADRELLVAPASLATGSQRRQDTMLNLVVRRFLRHRLAVIGVIVLAVLIGSALLAPAITQDPNALSVSERPAAMQRYDARHREWLARADELGTNLPEFGMALPLDERLPSAQFGAAYRAPLRESYLSATEDGKPAAPLMGQFPNYDGGETALGLGPFTYMLAYNDYATFFQFIPREAEQSDIVVTWLVNGDAREGTDYDRTRLTWLWTVTTQQDKSIIEANAAGIHSSRYEPGPSSLLEYDLDGFREWYLGVTGPASRRQRLSRRGGGRYFGI